MSKDILGLSTKPIGNDTSRVKDLVREAWSVPEDVIIMVSKLRCYEDGCPDVETVIALMSNDREPIKVTINKPMAELDAVMINVHRPG